MVFNITAVLLVRSTAPGTASAIASPRGAKPQMPQLYAALTMVAAAAVP
jgi:hypothetical protein